VNVGDVVGNYRITRVLGEGGMGVVYLGTHTLIGREAAIKVLLPSLSNKQEVVQRFFNEAKTTTSIKHPGIVEIYDFGYSDEGHAYIVMERLEGETLGARIRRLGKLSPEQSLGLLSQITRALGAAHKLGVVHRDLKPENIYIVADPEVASGERAKILDFGIAKLRNAGHVGIRTASGQVMGPPGYMAPEQCLGASEVDPRADLYALGCILFHMLCGRPPFEGPSFADIVAAHVGKEPRLPSSLVSGLPPSIDHLTRRLLEKSPEARPQSTDALLELLDAGSPGRRPAASAPPPVPDVARRRTMRTSAPPPIPTAGKRGAPPRPQNVQIDPDLLDSGVPLPPLPRPLGGGDALHPPVKGGPAYARTLYTGRDDEDNAPPRPKAGGPRKPDPALARTALPGPTFQASSGPGLPPSPGPRPSPPGGGPPAGPVFPTPPRPSPPASGSPPGPAFPQAPPPNQGAPPSPGLRVPQFPSPAPAPPPPQAPPDPNPGSLPSLQPLQRPVGQRPDPYAHVPARMGHAVRPEMPPRRSSGLLLPVFLIVLTGAGVGGFFLYQSLSSGQGGGDEVAAATPDGGGAAAKAASDAGVAATSTADAAAVVAAAGDAGLAVAATKADAAPVAAPPPDAAPVVAASPPDAAPVATRPPVDAAPRTAPTPAGGRVRDPALAQAGGVETVVLRIDSRPRGARITRRHDSLVLGQTPIEYETRKINANEEFVIELGGHYPVNVKMTTNRDNARLVPLLVRPKSR
jgi:serine/threonine protein kinase